MCSQFYADIKSDEHKTDYMSRARDRTKIIITITQSQRFGDLNKVIDI